MSTPFLVFVFDVVSLVQTAWRCRFALAHGAHTRAAGPARAGLAAGRRQDRSVAWQQQQPQQQQRAAAAPLVSRTGAGAPHRFARPAPQRGHTYSTATWSTHSIEKAACSAAHVRPWVRPALEAAHLPAEAATHCV